MINSKEVKRIAELGYIQLDEKEAEKYTQELSKIIDFFEILKKINTQNVKPLLGSSDLEDVIFEDNPKICPQNKEIVKRAPKKQGRYVKTKAVFS